jgi:formate--tetrahydrofolate ligase
VPQGRLKPDCVVVVATIRALKMHGGVEERGPEEGRPRRRSKRHGNLQRHIENIKKFGLPAVVSINRFSADTDAEIALVKESARRSASRR